MPLIYSGIDDAIMTFPEGYAEAFNRRIQSITNATGLALPFGDFDGFREWVRGQIKNINGGDSTLEATRRLLDNVNHFSQANQEAILSVSINDNNDLTLAISSLVQSINGMHGQEFNNQQIKLLGVAPAAAAPPPPPSPPPPPPPSPPPPPAASPYMAARQQWNNVLLRGNRGDAPALPHRPGIIRRGKNIVGGSRKSRKSRKSKKNRKNKKSKRRRN